MTRVSKFLFSLTLLYIFLRPFIAQLVFPRCDYFLWLLLVGSAAPFIVFNRKKIMLQSVDVILGIFIAAIALSILTATRRLNSAMHLYGYAGNIILFYFVRTCAKGEKALVLKAMFFSCAVLCCYGLYQFLFAFQDILAFLDQQGITHSFAREWLERKRVIATFFTPNAFAGYLAMLIPLFVYLRRIDRRDFSGRLFAVSMILLITNLILTFSIGTFLSILITCFLVILAKKRKKSIWIVASIALSIMLFGIFFWRYSSNIKTLSPVFSLNDRIAYYKEALAMITQEPWRGIGIGNFRGANSLFVHNSYLQLWIEMGFIGFVAFVSFVAVMIKRNRERINAQSALFAAFLIFVIHNLFSFTFFLPEVSWVWWIVAGLIVG